MWENTLNESEVSLDVANKQTGDVKKYRYVKWKLIVVEGKEAGGEVCKGKGKKWG